MNAVVDHLLGRAADLRREFDRGFAAPPAHSVRTTVDLVLVQLGPDRHAVRIAEIAGLFADMKVTPCPSPVPSLRGLAGFRGTVMPVYDLAQLVGYPRAETPRWIVVAAAAPVALAFEDFAGHLSVEAQAIAPRRDSNPGNHAPDTVRSDDGAWPLVSIPSVVATIKRQQPDAAQSKE